MRLLITKWYGARVVDEKGKVHEERLFPETPAEVADRLARLRAGEVLDEERELAGGDVGVTEQRQRPLGALAEGAVPRLSPPESRPVRLLHAALMELGSRDARSRAGERDRWLVHAMRVVDELQRTINTLTERLREWYGLADPTSADTVTDQAEFVALASGRPPSPPAEGGAGAELAPEQAAAVAEYAKGVKALLDERARLEAVVSREAKAVAPALCTLVGEAVAARLIAQAGGLERLAFLPASTIQTLGAEGALFAHLRKGHKPPKHGVIYQHPAVFQTHPRLRGRAARTLAAKAALAARMDRFGTQDGAGATALKAQFDQALARIRATKPKPRATEPRGRRR